VEVDYKMKQVYLLIIFLAICYGKEDLQFRGYQNKKGVKEERVAIYSYEQKFGEYIDVKSNEIKLSYNRNGYIINSIYLNTEKLILDPIYGGTLTIQTNMNQEIIKYDSRNNLVECSDYMDKSLVLKLTWEYDINNNIVEYSMYDNDGSLISKKISKYDRFNREIEIYDYLDNGDLYLKYINEFDRNGNRKKTSRIEPDNTIIMDVTYKYDTSNNLVEKYYFSYPEEGPPSKHIYTYDRNNNKISHVFRSDKLETKDTFRYDSINILIEEDHYEYDIIKWGTEYRYNYNNRIVEKIEYYYENKFGQLYKVPAIKTIYQYTYY